MPGHDIIVIGASTGGLEALQALLPGLNADTPAALFVVWHMAADSLGLLPDLLRRVSPLPIANAEDREPIAPGRIYVAPPDHHLLIEQGRVRLTRGPKENRFRPAIDPLFRSAANTYGPRVTGVVLSGALDDGTAGLWAIKDRGGVTLVQDLLDAIHPSMPRSAAYHVKVDHILPARAIGPLLSELAWTPIEQAGVQPMSERLSIETQIAMEDNALEAGVMKLGTLSPFTCPECHGTLVQLVDGSVLRFRCHTGHAYSVQTLFAEVAESIEASLWGSLRVIEERMMLLDHMARHLREAGDGHGAKQLLGSVREAEQQAELVRQAVMRHGASSGAALWAAPPETGTT